MSRTNFDQLLQAGCHFGHLRRKWNPAMAPYIFMERNGIHIIDLNKTVAKIDEAAEALKTIAKTGRKILFVATKKQAKDVVAEKAASINMPYVNERWAGGMLTNFPTIRKAVKKMTNIDRLLNDGTFSNLSKRELLQVSRQRAKLEKNLGSIADMARLPVALFVVDVMKEHIAVKEANRLGIPVFGIVDTNSDPKNVDYVIPANDDAKDSVDAILTAVCGAIAEALEERKAEKVVVCCTFGLFTAGFEKFDEFYQKGYIDSVVTTNLNYRSPELFTKEWYVEADMSKYIAAIINSLNHDVSIGNSLSPTDKIQKLIRKYNEGLL